jgi:hypothetical protein
MYHDVTSVADRLSENTQRVLLQNAVLRLDTLRQVQITSDLQSTTGGIALTFAQYKSLLINAATGYDKQQDKPGTNGKSRRSVFSTETLFNDYDVGDDIYDNRMPDFDYDVDAAPAELLAYAMNRRERPQFKSGSRMPIARWKALSEEAKAIWDKMGDDDKAKILAPSEQRRSASQPPASKYSVNTHDVTSTSGDPPQDSDDVLIAMVTKHSNLARPPSHPGNVRSVLSQPAKSANVQVKEDEISVNGHTYVRQVHSHDIQYTMCLAPLIGSKVL